MTCGDKGRLPSASNNLSQHTRFLLGPVEAKTIVTNMTEQVSGTSYDTVRATGVTLGVCCPSHFIPPDIPKQSLRIVLRY
jgi:hypothetical protein